MLSRPDSVPSLCLSLGTLSTTMLGPLSFSFGHCYVDSPLSLKSLSPRFGLEGVYVPWDARGKKYFHPSVTAREIAEHRLVASDPQPLV